MTAPRRILPGGIYMLSRRCIFRLLLLRPSEEANELLRYILAVVAERYGILLHAFCFMSNHLHMIVSDPLGKLPAFERDLDALVARSFNALLGRTESFWAPGSYSAVELVTPEAILEKTAYVLTNPVVAGLVRRGSEWPGLWSMPELIGAGPITVKRPSFFFRKDGPMPETARLELVCPPGFESAEAFRDRLVALLTAVEEQTARERAAKGRGFLGARAVLAQDVEARPVSEEPIGGLNPRIACRDRWKRVEAIHRLKAFLSDYRAAWQSFSSGVRDAVFPAGTYWMRVAYGVQCAPSG
jgi:REP element-mobilizing transposase RayT